MSEPEGMEGFLRNRTLKLMPEVRLHVADAHMRPVISKARVKLSDVKFADDETEVVGQASMTWKIERMRFRVKMEYHVAFKRVSITVKDLPNWLTPPQRVVVDGLREEAGFKTEPSVSASRVEEAEWIDIIVSKDQDIWVWLRMKPEPPEQQQEIEETEPEDKNES
jgi:hypothetical protein